MQGSMNFPEEEVFGEENSPQPAYELPQLDTHFSSKTEGGEPIDMHSITYVCVYVSQKLLV